jgi:hypothetical protein
MHAALDPQTEQYLKAFKKLHQEEQQLVMRTLAQLATVEEPCSSNADNFAEALSGRRFNRQERVQLELETLARHFLHRRQLLEKSLTAPQVAHLLGTTRQTPHDRVDSKTLLAIRDNGKLRFPAWQFDPTGPDGVMDGLPQVLKALEMSDYAKLNWFTRPNPYLNGLTPAQALKQGQRERVAQEAAAAGASQWS